MEYKKTSRQFIKIVIPIAVQNLLTSFVSASDALMLGGLNQSSLSAVSLATQVTFIINLFYMALTIGTTILSAQYWGNGQKDRVEDILSIVLKYSCGISLVFWAASLGVPQWLMRIFTDDEELIALGIPYLRIVSWSYLCMGITQIYLCTMKNTERTLKSTIYATIALLINLILNGILIFGLFGFPELGIKGAALATVIARIAELAFVLYENGKKDVVKFRLWKFVSYNKGLNRDFIKYTTPVLANSLAWGCGFTMFSVIMGHLGNDAVAANSIANIVKNIIACVCLGIGTGSGIIVGNVLGTGELQEAKKLGDRLCRVSIIAGAVSGFLILAISPLVVSMSATLTQEAKNYLQVMLFVCSYYIIGKSVNSTVISGIFCAGGDTKFGLICDTITMWLIVVPLGLVTAFVLKLPVLWVYALLNIDEIIKLPAVYHYYKKYRWIKNIIKGGSKNMTMHERILKGMLFTDMCEGMPEERIQAKKLMKKFNDSEPDDFKGRAGLINELLKEGEGVWIEPPFYFCYGKHISIGKGSYINVNCNFIDDGEIVIGERVMFGPAVTIATVGHPINPDMREYMYAAPVHIENNVWIGGNVTICPGVTIGENSVVGAGSVVIHDVPANCIAAGNPARIIRQIEERDKEFYFKNRRINADDLEEETRLRRG